jgi:hypothetical protein
MNTQTNTIIPVGNNVEGNITSCKIEEQKIQTNRNSVFSITQKDTYASYDVCSKQIIRTYDIPHFTGFGLFLGLTAVFILCTIIATAMSKDSY